MVIVMERLGKILENLPRIQGWSDILDILLVAFLIYELLPVFRSTGTARIALIAVTVVVLTSITKLLELNTLFFILQQLLSVGLLALVILFQPEIRRMIDHMSNIKLKELLHISKPSEAMVPVITQTVRACEVMSREKVGALIVFARNSHVEEYFKTGTVIDAQVSEQLIRNVFFPRASLHDGAMFICDGRVAAAGCVLPLSESDRISADLGTRHRAALGMSEATDAVVVVVSEETGAISVAVGGMLKRHLAAQTLEKLLQSELCPDPEGSEENIVVKLRQKLTSKSKKTEEDSDEK